MRCIEAVAGDYVKVHILPRELDANTSFSLPVSRTGADEDILISLESVNGSWKINNDPLHEDAPLHCTYRDHDRDLPVTLRLCALKDAYFVYDKFYITPGRDVVIGRAVSAEIRLTDAARDEAEDETAVLSWQENECVITCDTSARVYVNQRRITRHVLQFLDQIYLDGIRLIFLGDALAINETGTRVKCTLPPYHSPETAPAATGSFSNQDKRFLRSPRIYKKITPHTLEIEPPPQPKKQRFTPFMLQVGASVSMGAVMVLGLVVRMASGSGNNITMAISGITILGSLAGMVIFPKKMRSYQQKKIVMDEAARRNAYQAYLQEKERLLSEFQTADAGILTERYPSPVEQAERIRFTLRQLWERSPKNDDFLDIRFGTGRRTSFHRASVADEGFTIEKDPLWPDLMALESNYRVMKQVPVSLELAKEIIVGIIGRRALCLDMLEAILLHIAASHSYNDVKLIYVSDKQDTSLDYIRWLPHTWNDNRSFRYVAHDNASLNEILDMLSTIMNERKELKEKSSKDEIYIPHFVVVCTSQQMLKNGTFQSRFLSSYDDIDGIGLSFIIVANTIDGLPLFCDTILKCSEDQYGIYRANDPSNLVYLFKPDQTDSLDLPKLARQLFATRTLDVDENRMLPDILPFLSMYNASSVEDLKIAERWQTSDSAFNIRGAIGATSSGNFLLDIHEKAHGPHGLIAGTTGSGKSEFIQSFILSLAINYHPYDISFIIIDYKGGGTAQAFRHLPHLAGYITNLDGNQIQRSLATLQIELTRRQQLFSQMDVNHIDKYQRLYKEGKTNIPIPHLIIVADEFAELKQNKPEFMQKLVSTARIGRSLGVHLILATQRPTGVVDDQIVSNTRFRICLKVAGKSDSREMLKRDEAAEITQTGRAYVQVGNDEIFSLIQTGWSGSPYMAGDKRKKTNKPALYLLDDNGRICMTEESDKRQTNKELPTQLEVLVKELAGIAREMGIAPLRLWTEPLAEKIYLEDIVPAPFFDGQNWLPNNKVTTAMVGLLDDVPAQRHRPLSVKIGEKGHAAVFGQVGTGKSAFLQTFIYALARDYAPDRVQFYLIDCEGRNTGYFRKLPHMGDVVFAEEEQKLKKLFKMIDLLITERQALIEKDFYPDLEAYRKAEMKTVPDIIIILRNMAAFMEMYKETHEEKLTTLTRDGARYGIHLVFFVNAVNDLRLKIQQNIPLLFCLQLANAYDYSNILGKADDLVPDGVFGRGLVRRKYLMEFQTALAVKPDTPEDTPVAMEPEEEEIYRIRQLQKRFEAMRAAWLDAGQKTAPAIPVIPALYRVSDALQTETYREALRKKRVPVGYDMLEIELFCPDLDRISVYPIVGAPKTGKTNFVKSLLMLFRQMEDAVVFVADNREKTLREAAQAGDNVRYAATEAEVNALMDAIKDMGLRRKQEYDANRNTYFPPAIFLADDFAHLFKNLSDYNVKILNDLMRNGKKLGITIFISIGKRNDYTGTDIIDSLFLYNQGILLGGNYESYSYFTASMDYRKKEAIFNPGIAYCFDNGQYWQIKTALAE